MYQAIGNRDLFSKDNDQKREREKNKKKRTSSDFKKNQIELTSCINLTSLTP